MRALSSLILVVALGLGLGGQRAAVAFQRTNIGLGLGRPSLLIKAATPLFSSTGVPLENTGVTLNNDKEATAPSPNSITDVNVSEWHRQRRREMMKLYGNEIAPLEREASSQAIGVPLLVATCASLWGLAIFSGGLAVWQVVLLAAFPGSILSLWQLQILHDVIHGSFFPKGQSTVWGTPRNKLQDRVLFWASLPSVSMQYTACASLSSSLPTRCC